MAALQAEDESQIMIYEVKDLTFSYPSGDRNVLADASLTLEKGEGSAFWDPTGQAKPHCSTAWRGFCVLQKGFIKLCGKELSSLKVKEIAATVGYVPQLHTPAFDYRSSGLCSNGKGSKTGTFGKPTEADERLCMGGAHEHGHRPSG